MPTSQLIPQPPPPRPLLPSPILYRQGMFCQKRAVYGVWIKEVIPKPPFFARGTVCSGLELGEIGGGKGGKGGNDMLERKNKRKKKERKKEKLILWSRVGKNYDSQITTQ